ncbi:hypothetical protein WM23_03975 [Burkholderia ubonensis]|nr:hypothetical protein WM23_03975 [Burkholderia ubonensis]
MVNTIAQIEQCGLKKLDGYHRCSLVESTMCRLKKLIDTCLMTGGIELGVTDVAGHMGLLPRMTELARMPSARIS